MAKHGKAKGAAANGELETGRGADFQLIQPLDMTAIKTATIRSPDRRDSSDPAPVAAKAGRFCFLWSESVRSSCSVAARWRVLRPFAGPRTALPRLPPPQQRALVVMAATLTAQV